MATQGKLTTLRIIDATPVYHGRNQKGDDYTIYEIRAAKPDGTLIDQKLRSFTALPVGQTIEVTVTPYVSEQYGRSFTLYPKNKGAGTTAQANDLSETVEQMREMISKLSSRVGELERRLGEVMRDDSRHGTSPPADAAVASDLDQRFGADAPFG